MAKYHAPAHAKPKKLDSEEAVQYNAVRYIEREYPGVVLRSDVASGLWLPPWIAAKFARLQTGGKGYPDVTIMAPRRGYHGLVIELKKAGYKLKKRDGRWSDDRVARQNRMLAHLDGEGYAAYFAVGLHEFKTIVDWYFEKGPAFNTVGCIPLIAAPPPVVDDGPAF